MNYTIVPRIVSWRTVHSSGVQSNNDGGKQLRMETQHETPVSDRQIYLPWGSNYTKVTNTHSPY